MITAPAERSFLTEPEAVNYLSRYGIPYPEHGCAGSAGEAARLASRLGYPVVLKIVSPDVVHKSDVGGVEVGLGSARVVRAGYGRILESVAQCVPGARIEAVLVSRQVPPGLEVIVGGLQDPMFGPQVMFGLGGIFAEILQDVTFRVVPISRLDAETMIREIKGYRLLAGSRNQPPCDVDALAGLILRVSRMMEENPEIEELDLNPVRVFENGVMVLDARILRKEFRSRQA